MSPHFSAHRFLLPLKSFLTHSPSPVLLSGMHHDKIFRLAGAYRHLVTVAKNVRLAPVHTSKNKIPIIPTTNTVFESNNIDEEIVYDAWSYNRENQPDTKKTEKIEKTETENNENKPAPHIVEIPDWKIIKEPSSGERSFNPIDYPFTAQVEKLWENDIIPNLLIDIYRGSSSATFSKNIGMLPSSLSGTIEPKKIEKIEKNDENKIKNGVKLGDSGSVSSSNVLIDIKSIEGKIDKIKKKTKKELKLEQELLEKAQLELQLKTETEIDAKTEGHTVVEEIEGVRISFSLCASAYATTFLDHLTDTINLK